MKNLISLVPGKRKIYVESELDGNTLNVSVRISRDLKRYFRKDQFFIRYEQEIEAGAGVLSVPAVALLLPLAWLTGSQLHVTVLDRTFADSAEALRKAYSHIYPKIPFDTELVVEERVDSPANPEGAAMLFSGGLDATYSFYANRHLRPRLVEVFGTEFPVTNDLFLQRVRNETDAFAERHDVAVSYIYTDFAFFFDQRAVIHKFAAVREKVNGDLWKGMGYALGFLSMMAPLSVGRFNHAIIAAWADRERADNMREYPDSSSPGVDQKIAWTNLRVEHHGCLHRYEKAREMRDWLPGNPLRVCWLFEKAQKHDGAVNCNRCEKCARSIVALAIGGVDPRDCGFVVDEGTIRYIRKRLEKRMSKASHMSTWWKPMQEQVPEHIDNEMFGLRELMEWFRAFDLGDGKNPPQSGWTLQNLYYRFPYPLAVAVRSAIFGVLGEPYWMNQAETGKNDKSRDFE